MYVQRADIRTPMQSTYLGADMQVPEEQTCGMVQLQHNMHCCFCQRVTFQPSRSQTLTNRHMQKRIDVHIYIYMYIDTHYRLYVRTCADSNKDIERDAQCVYRERI